MITNNLITRTLVRIIKWKKNEEMERILTTNAEIEKVFSKVSIGIERPI